VTENDLQKSRELLNIFRAERKAKTVCPKCGSHNVEFVSTPRKPGNWLSVIILGFLASFAPPVEKVYHCFDCKHEFGLVEEKDPD
jgi:DNA-directed RNA polymerase subunit RPC12/RpoP